MKLTARLPVGRLSSGSNMAFGSVHITPCITPHRSLEPNVTLPPAQSNPFTPYGMLPTLSLARVERSKAALAAKDPTPGIGPSLAATLPAPSRIGCNRSHSFEAAVEQDFSS